MSGLFAFRGLFAPGEVAANGDPYSGIEHAAERRLETSTFTCKRAREMSLNIRQELPSDVAAIHDLTRAAFLNATHTTHTEQYIVDALRKAGALPISLVAEQAGEIVGHVAVSPVSISDRSADWYGLGPISVRPELQRKGIGSLLMQAALRRLRDRGSTGCVLVGDPSYYSRFGFKAEASLVLADVPPEYFQALPFGPSLPSGMVTFHEAFRARDSK